MKTCYKTEEYCKPCKNKTLERNVFNLKLQKKSDTKESLVTDTNWTVLLKFGKELTRAENRRGCDKPGTSTAMRDYQETQKEGKSRAWQTTGVIQSRTKFIEIRQISDTVSKIDNPISHQKRNPRQKIMQSSENLRSCTHSDSLNERQSSSVWGKKYWKGDGLHLFPPPMEWLYWQRG